MPSEFTYLPSAHSRRFFHPDGETPFKTGADGPIPFAIMDIDCGLAVSATPTAVTMTISYDNNTVTIIGGTLRVKGTFGTDAMASVRYARIWARRKPGTSGAIAAQLIILKGSPGGTATEIGRIRVSAIAAGDLKDPKSDVFELVAHAGHANWTMSGSNTLIAIFEQVDPDLELVVEAFGVNN